MRIDTLLTQRWAYAREAQWCELEGSDYDLLIEEAERRLTRRPRKPGSDSEALEFVLSRLVTEREIFIES